MSPQRPPELKLVVVVVVVAAADIAAAAVADIAVVAAVVDGIVAVADVPAAVDPVVEVGLVPLEQQQHSMQQLLQDPSHSLRQTVLVFYLPGPLQLAQQQRLQKQEQEDLLLPLQQQG